MQNITAFFDSLGLAPALRSQLFNETTAHHHRFYVELVQALAPAFPGVAADALQELSLSSYLYFRYQLFTDGLLDGEQSAQRQSDTYLVMQQLYQRAMRGLTSLFAMNHPFWNQLGSCHSAYSAAIVQEQVNRVVRERGRWSQQAYEQLAVGKSAVSEALVYALAGLQQPGHPAGEVATVLRALRQFHLAQQYEDDVDDFLNDWKRGEFTYAHAQLLAHPATSDLPADAPGELLHGHLYTSGVAGALLSRARLFYLEALALSKEVGLPVFSAFCNRFLSDNATRRAQIDQEITRATNRALGQYDGHTTILAA